MNETRNEIKKVCEFFTREEAIELCKELIAENEELKAINYILRLIMSISDAMVKYNESANFGR